MNNKINPLLLAFFLAAATASTVAQEAAAISPNYYWVFFTDKPNSPYSITEPEEFLSQRSISRRQKRSLPITEEDFPPNPDYLAALIEQGAVVHHRSRWLNAATILIDEGSLSELNSLPFVDSIFYAGFPYPPKASIKRAATMDSLLSPPIEGTYYGYGGPQAELLNGDTLHRLGYSGQGILLAVLDGGFTGVDQSPFFDSLRQSGRLLLAHDFVDGDLEVYESSSHGTRVLSAMGANIPGVLVGTAPEASYACIKTEDTRGEYRIEECHWVAGLEYADSIGADVVNSSLGYTTFNDRKMDYDYSQLDGATSVASQAADIAYRKGMIVVTSAGNEGNSKWKHIGIPADARTVLAVGATDLAGERASFSSVGPTADGRIKPDVVGPGAWVALADAYSFSVSPGSGTSFAAPIVAGLVSCLWQAFPDKTNTEIIEAVRESAHLADKPDNKLGYGLPDFGKAFEWLSTKEKAGTPPPQEK